MARDGNAEMKNTKFTVKYYTHNIKTDTHEFSHEYEEHWAESPDIHCPNCGDNKFVWTEQGIGDYYVGPQSICSACAYSFHLPYSDKINGKDSPGVQRLANLIGAT